MGNVTTVMTQGRKHTRQCSQEILDRWKIFWMWINGSEGHHLAGRAVDLMTLTANQGQLRTRVGNEIAAYARKHHKRLGIQYVIWRQRIWNATRSDDANRKGWSTWRKMEDRGSTTANHMDHVHISFLNSPPTYRPSTASAGTAHAGETRYVVKHGDTLTAIASRHGTTVSAIVKRNNIPDPDVINVGQVLFIP
jgi:LysM repeat protein